MHAKLQQLARVQIDHHQGLQPHALRRLHREEVDRPDRILRSRAHALEVDLPPRKRREAVLAEDPLDRWLAYSDTHPA